MGTVWTLRSGARLEEIRCGECGTTFAMPEVLTAERLKDGKTFYCPNGHGRAFIDSELERTKKMLAQRDVDLERQTKRTEWEKQEATQQRKRADREERRGRSLKGHQTRLRKRLAAGQCPCCTETFKDLEAHIAAKHPRYKPKPDAGEKESNT